MTALWEGWGEGMRVSGGLRFGWYAWGLALSFEFIFRFIRVPRETVLSMHAGEILVHNRRLHRD